MSERLAELEALPRLGVGDPARIEGAIWAPREVFR